MKKCLRKVHIDNNEWKYYVNYSSVIIFSPTKQRYDVDIYECSIGFNDDPRNVTPASVKEYIEQKIVSGKVFEKDEELV